MKKPLRDQNLPAGAIVEEYDDGGALRNDGVKLRPANENPWYVLATVYGEYDFLFRSEIEDKNRRIWNGWMCEGLSASERTLLAKTAGLKSEDLSDLIPQEREDLEAALLKRSKTSTLPEAPANIKFRNTYFAKSMKLNRFIFNRYVDFGFCNFKKSFMCNGSVFDGGLDFEHSEFQGNLSLNLTVFESRAQFQNCYFQEDASFLLSRFNARANFSNSVFAKSTTFVSVNFLDAVNFSNGAFKGTTNFLAANFWKIPPKFFQRNMHQDCSFSLQTGNWPEVTADNAEEGKGIYARLRRIMNDLHKPDDEHFFFRREMECKALLENSFDKAFIKGYGMVSDYGYSVMRPIACLSLNVAFGWVTMSAYLEKITGTAHPIAEGLGLSIANTFPFLGFIRRFHGDVYKDAPNWIEVIAGTQSILGVILLFFLGLGLRNRFRLK